MKINVNANGSNAVKLSEVEFGEVFRFELESKKDYYTKLDVNKSNGIMGLSIVSALPNVVFNLNKSTLEICGDDCRVIVVDYAFEVFE